MRVQPRPKPRGRNPFEFMNSEVSSEKPKALLVAQVADRLQACRAAGGKSSPCAGPP